MIALLAVAYCLVRIFSRTIILHGARQVEFRVREALFARLLQLDQSFLPVNGPATCFLAFPTT